ncbi:hypothetical protein, partial [Serratia marcescens]|uniref:hypothetical protein n=1 Tax=Serratia marcescens TaxID=615 RepID=UPI001CA4B082
QASKIYKSKGASGGYTYSIKVVGSEEKQIDCSDEEYDMIVNYLHMLNKSVDNNKNFKVRLQIGKIAYIRNQY